MEDVAARTEHSRTYRNPDGTNTTTVGATAVNYETAEGWKPIDASLLAVGEGVWRTAANRWSATFAPIAAGGVSISDGDVRLAMTPVDALPSVPVVGLDRSSVTYDEVWPGVDLRYRVSSAAVKEDLVLERRPATNTFTFATGVPFTATDDGGLRPTGAAGARWRVPPPVVLDRRGLPVDGEVARFVPAADGSAEVDVVVDPAWLDGLSDADFPVIVDPTLTVGSDYSAAFRSSVASCGPPCSVRVGNPDTSWNTWRSVVRFPYQSLFGKSASYAHVSLWGLAAGSVGDNKPMTLVQSTGDNWSSFGTTLVSNSWGTNVYTLASSTLNAYMDNWLRNHQLWKFKFIGDESSPNNLSYKQLDGFELRVDWNYIAPSLTASPWASPSTVFEDQTVTVSQPWTHSADQARLFVCQAPGVTVNGCTGGTWASSGYGGPGTAQASFVPGHNLGGRSYWTYMCSVGACSGASSGSFTVLNRAPVAGTITADRTTVPEGQRITWTVPFTDTNTGVSLAVICKTASSNGGACDAGQAWATNSGYVGSPARSYFDVPANHPAGTYTWYGFACDADGACSTPAQSGTFTIQDLAAPGTLNDSPDPVYVGDTITFSYGWTSSEGQKLVVCKTDAITQGTAACPGGQWTAGSVAATSPSTATYAATTADVGTRSYWAFLCTSTNACTVPGGSDTFLVKDPPDVVSASDSPDPVYLGSPVTFTVNWNNSVETVKAVVCKTNEVTHGTATCPGGEWATGTEGTASAATATFTPTASDVGTRGYYAFACTAGGACSATSATGTFLVKDPPDVVSASDSPDPVYVASPLTFTVNWNNSVETVKAVVCKTNEVTHGAATCPGGEWATGAAGAASAATATFTPTASDVGTRGYYAFACTAGGACSATSATGTFLVKDPPDVPSASDSPDPVHLGSAVTFTVNWNNSAETVKAVVCKSNAITHGTATCPGGQWASGTAGASSPATATFTPTASDVGSRTYYAFACTAGGACSANSAPGTFVVKDPPDVVSVTDSPDPVDPGSPLTFTVDWNNSVETVKAVVCKTNAVTQGAATCPGGQWASGTEGASSPATATFTPTASDSGNRSYFAFACTAGGACSANSASGTFQVTHVPADSVTADPASQVRPVREEAVVTITAKDASGGPAPNAPVIVSRSGANPQEAQTFTADASGIYSYRYTGQNPGLDEITVTNGVGGGSVAVTVAWVPNPSAQEYPSDACSTSGNVISGYLGDQYLHVRQDADPLDPDRRRVCITSQEGLTHLGGQLALSAGSGSVSPDVGVDTSKEAAESCLAIGTRVDSGLIAGMPYYIDVAPNPNGGNGAWTCTRIGATYLRLRFAASAPVSVDFLPDQPAPKPYEDLPVPGLYSRTCKANGGDRVMNVLVGDTPVSLYTWSESATKAHVCGRTGTAGGRLDVDTAALPSYQLGNSKDASTPFAVFDNGTLALWTVDPVDPTVPAGVYVGALNGAVGARVTVTNGSGSTVAFHQDPS